MPGGPGTFEINENTHPIQLEFYDSYRTRRGEFTPVGQTPELTTYPTLAPPALTRRLRAAIWALRTQFFVAGALFATWGVHVPSIKRHYDLDEQLLAVSMMAAGVGSVVALLFAGKVLAHFSPRRVAPVLVLVCTASIASLVVPSGFGWLLLLMLSYGIAAALFDVAINDEATTIEREAGRPLMSGFHGMFSVGGMAGAATWTVLAGAGASPMQHLAGAAGALAVLALCASAFMLRQDRNAQRGTVAMSLPRGALALLGLLAAAGLIAEGAMYDWSVLYLRQELDASPGIASLGYASFSAAMAAGRFAGDWVRERTAPVALLRMSGAAAAVGMSVALAAPHSAVALAGYALVGLGLANVVPVLFSAAGQQPDVSAAHGIAAVSSLGYFGMMIGPPMIGFIAQAQSLRAGLLVVIVFAMMVTALSRRALRAS